MKYIVPIPANPSIIHPPTCYNTTAMKYNNRTQPILSTKTDTRYPKIIHPKTDQNHGNKNVPNRKFQKVSYHLINPVSDWHNPENQNVPRNEKHPFLVRFLKEQKTDVFTSKTQTLLRMSE